MEANLSKPLVAGAYAPTTKDNRWNRELRATIERALKFSGVKYHWLRTSISPNSDTLAPVRTVDWSFFAYELGSPLISGNQIQHGPHSNLRVLRAIGDQLRHEKASDGVRFKFWVWCQWSELTTEAE